MDHLYEISMHAVTEVRFGDTTSLAGSVLTVDRNAARDTVLAAADGALGDVRLSWASPGEATRIVKLLDAVEPRAKVPTEGDASDCFPGLAGPALSVGRGRTHALSGVAVVAAGYLPRAQESLVDMSGPGADLSPLSTTHNLVVEFTPAGDATWEDVDTGLRRGILRLARDLARAAFEVAGAETTTWPLQAAAGADGGRLPRVGAITNLQTQGRFKDVFVYGRSYAEGLPTLIEMPEVLDGAVVSGQFGHPALKNPTYLHQNHPVARALIERHGSEVDFAGVVIAPEPVDGVRKEVVSTHAARLCRAAGWDAAIVTKEGGGNADGDMALKMDALEDEGMVAVGIFAEMSGPDGSGPPVVVAPSRATAMISTGNYDERISLPAMDRALGADHLALVGAEATAALEIPVAAIYGSNNPLGWGRLTARPAPAADLSMVGSGSGDHEGPVRVVHYINQFFAGLGGEDSADVAPTGAEGALGPGRKLAALLGDGFEVVATVYCGDDRATSGPEALDQVLELIKPHSPDLVVAGPAFTSGRYGLACARLAALCTESGIPAVAAMHPDNPGLDEAGSAVVVAAGEAARTMGASLERLASTVRHLADGQAPEADALVGKVLRRNALADAPAAQRAVDLVLARLGGDRDATEVPLPRFDHVHPAAHVEDLSGAVVAILTEGALVPDANPDKLESARATKWCRYSLEGLTRLEAGSWRSVHGGFSTQWANEDPHRILPLDVARDLESEGRIAGLHPEYLTTAGNGTSVANARRFGVEWAADLRRSEARAAILTST